MVAPSSERASDSNLLFAVLALQRGFLDQDRFVDACAAWAARRDTPIPKLLIERSWITPDDQQKLQEDMDRLLKKHQGDVHASVHEVAGADEAVQRSLGQLFLDPAWANLRASDLKESGDHKTPPPRQRYQKLGEPKKGGIGQVWRAKDTHLGRVVALKELRPDRVLSTELRDRFLAEAQINARLVHPNIIPAFELGDGGGLDGPFYTMQFVDGPTLDDAIRDFHARRKQGQAGNLELRRLLNAYAAVCKAVDYAHSRGIVHRDLKGSNVILGEHGEVFLLDWGMAKVISNHPANERADPVVLATTDAATVTRAGDKLGTPAYMAPEQAAGKTDQIDCRTDVYALGVILYEILTNRLPFAVETTPSLFADLPADPDARKNELSQRQVNRILYQIIHTPAPAPRSIDSLVPIPLEKVCLKALAKKKAERYASAGELANEIERWLADEPVSAWPEPWTVRAGRWMRRHRPWVAGAVSLLAAALPLLTILIVLSESAREKLEIEQGKTKDALEVAKTNEATAKEKKAEAIAARDALETTLARSLLRPLALQAGYSWMTYPEWEALWELASNRGGSLGYRFVEEASRGRGTSRQLRDRAALALHAVVGLDARRRDEVETLLLARLDNPALAAEQKTDLALAAAAWGDLSVSASRRMAQQLIQAIKDTKDLSAEPSLARALSGVAARMGAKEAADVVAPAAVTLTQAINDAKDPQVVSWLAQALSALADRMGLREAAPAAATLTQAIKDANYENVRELARALSAVTARMGPTEAADVNVITQAAATLTRAIENDKDPRSLHSLEALSAVAARMGPKEAIQAADTLTRAIEKAKDLQVVYWLARALSAVTAQLGPTEAADATAQVATILTQAIENVKDPRVVYGLAEALAAVADRMGPKQAAPAAATLTQAIKDANDENVRNLLAKSLSMVAARMGAKEATRAAATLTQAIENAKDPRVVRGLVQSLPAVAARMGPKEATQAADTLTRAIEDDKNSSFRHLLTNALSAVAARMGPKEATQAADTLTRAIEKAKDPHVVYELAGALPALAAQLGAKQAARAAAALTQALKDAKDPHVVYRLAGALPALAARMGPKEAAPAAATLTPALKDAKDPEAVYWLARALSALAARMGAKEAVDVAAPAAALTQALKDAKDPQAVYWLAGALSALADRMGPKEAADAMAQAAAKLTQAIKDPKNQRALSWLAEALSMVAARMGPKEAAPAAVALTQAIKDTQIPAVVELAAALLAVTARMDSEESAATLFKAIADLPDLMSLAYLLSTASGPEFPLRATSATCVGTGHSLTVLPFLIVAAEPPPCRLSTQQLVELLKLPACVGDNRRLVLDCLGRRYQRRFADLWEFVAWAQEHAPEPKLDLTTPPKRPDWALRVVPRLSF